MEDQELDGYPVFNKENVESASIKGFEFDVSGTINASFRYFANLAYTYGQNITKNEPLRRTPPTFGRIGVEFSKSNFLTRPELQFAASQKRLSSGDLVDNRIDPNGTAAWQTLAIYSSYTWKALALNLAIQNLENADFRLHGSGINGIGRSAILGVKVSF